MLPELMGSKLRLDIMMLMLKSGPVYSLEIMLLFHKNLSAVQRQIRKLQKLGVIKGRFAHGRYYYDLDPKYYLMPELQALLEGHLASLPRGKRSDYYMSPDMKKRKNLLGWWL